MDIELRHTINEIGRRNPNFPRQWEFLDIDNLRFNRPVIICLSGSSTTENKLVNIIAKIIQNYLDLLFKTKDGKNALDYVDIIGIKYARKDRNTYEKGYITEEYVDKLTDALVDLLTNWNQHKLPLDCAKRKFAQITFFTYCYGKQVLENLINILNEKLAAVGYTPAEINFIFGASKEVSFAPHTFTGNKIPSVHIISNNDQIASPMLKNLYTEQQLTELNGITLHQDKPGFLYGQPCDTATAPCIQIISSKLLNTSQTSNKALNDHNIKCVSRDDNWDLKAYSPHDQSKYPFNADCVSQMIAWALCRGVENRMQNFKATTYIPNPDWGNLISELQSIVDSYIPEKLAKPTANFTGKKTNKNLQL